MAGAEFLMVIIKFKDGTDWFKANWVFRQLAEDTMAAFPNDNALGLVLEKAQAFGALFLDSMEANAATSTLEALRKVAEETIQGKIQGWKGKRPEDKEGQQMYLESITELLGFLRKQNLPPD